ncbi:hypothetical protein [Conexibacter sp. SYSU D00693]|uniref:hypothetical protein n=1 Tax=Conexibacter sp. SYSU D00693 TaxID=2812560 RepID=UPI00196A9679|nr:hypothetical protein [Conexibacter sp. SYSU D00693]
MRRAAVLSVAVLAPGASAAHAKPVTLWACHGPTGQPLGQAGLTPVQTGDATAAVRGAGCSAPAAPGDGLLAGFARVDPEGGSSAAWQADVPSSTFLGRVRVARATTSAGAPAGSGTPQRAVTRVGANALETLDLGAAPVDGVLDGAVTGGSVVAGVTCERPTPERCAAAAPGALTVSALALGVDDAVAPAGTVGGVRSPVTAGGALDLAVDALDDGAGLGLAAATVDGAVRGQAALAPGCGDLDPATAEPDVALPGCAARATGVALRVDLTGVPVGPHRLRVVVTDVAGNAATAFDGDVVVAAPPPPASSTVQLQVGTPRPPGSGTAGAGGGSPVPGTVAGTGLPCARPRLAMALDQRPLRTSKGRLVLRRGKRYRFKGRLTCLVGTVRRSAPRGLQVEVLSRTSRKVVRHVAATVRTSGVLTRHLAPHSDRTIVFRVRTTTGTSQVRLRILVSSRGRGRR